MAVLLARKCCCEPAALPDCNGSLWASAPDTVSVSVSVTWKAITCASETAPTVLGCPQAGYPGGTVYYRNYQTVTHTVIGTLHKAAEALWPGTMYVGNDPASVALSNNSAPLSWSVDVTGSGQRFVPVTVSIPPSPPFTCYEAVDFSPIHGDGGTLYPKIHIGCVTDYVSNCETVAPVSPRPVMTIGAYDTDDLSNESNTATQWPLNVVYPGDSSIFPPYDTLDSQEIAWPPIIAGCPPGNECDGCGTVLGAGPTCWSCRTTCVPRTYAFGFYFLSPIGHATKLVSEGTSIAGPYKMGDLAGGLCSSCDGPTAMPDCELQDLSWCTAGTNGYDKTKGVAYATGVVSP